MDALAPPTACSGTARELLRTGRLALREFAAGDEAALRRMHLDPRLRRHLIDDVPLQEPPVAARFVRRVAEVYRRHPGLGIWHTRLTGVATDDGFAGWFSLMPLAGHPGEVELGARLLPSLWGHGLALEGGEALLQHAFRGLGLGRVWALCDPANRGARLCLAALGFGPGVMAPCEGCEGGEAMHHVIDASRWRRAMARPRRERVQQAARRLRADPSTP